MADKHNILQIETVKDSRDIVGEGIEIVTAAGILGTSVPTPVERYATPVAPFGKADHRDVPPVGAEPPWRCEDDRSAGAPIPKMNPGLVAGFDHGGADGARRLLSGTRSDF